MTTHHQSVPIGASMAHLLHVAAATTSMPTTKRKRTESEGALSSPVAGPQTSPVPQGPFQPTLPCLLLPKGSPLSSSRRLLLQGPPHSGRTSLAMDLAYACAASASPCPCSEGVPQPQQQPPQQLSPCRCTCVTLYRLAARSTPQHPRDVAGPPDDFPMPCHCSNEQKSSSEIPHLVERDASNKGTAAGTAGQPVDSITPSSTSSIPWDPSILKRIRIHRVSSVREVLHDLLSVMGQPLHQQPSRAILVDDLDVLCSAGSRQPDLVGRTRADTQAPQPQQQHHFPHSGTNASATHHMMQALAVLVDTSHSLERVHGVLPRVLATVSSSHPMALVAPWMDTVVQLHPLNNRRTSWQAEVLESVVGGTSSSHNHIQRTTIPYSMVHNPLVGRRIEWEEQRQTPPLSTSTRNDSPN